MTYERKFPGYASQLIQLVSLVRLVFNQSTNQHEDQIIASEVRAMYHTENVQADYNDGGPLVTHEVNYFSFALDQDLIIGTYVIDENNKRWKIVQVVKGQLAGGRNLAIVDGTE